ncbi:hypothetical protein [Paenibacillus sp. RC67]|nr:hypothetical protein [Paenibacillus sp. RC67]
MRSELIGSGVTVGEITIGGGGDKVLMFFDPNGNRFWAIEEPK